MRVRWDGPSGAVNRDVGAATGEGDVLEHGQVVDVDDELGQNLVDYHADWHPAAGDEHGDLVVKSRVELNDVAAELGIENPGDYPNKRALAAAIAAAQAAGGGQS